MGHLVLIVYLEIPRLTLNICRKFNLYSQSTSYTGTIKKCTIIDETLRILYECCTHFLYTISRKSRANEQYSSPPTDGRDGKHLLVNNS